MRLLKLGASLCLRAASFAVCCAAWAALIIIANIEEGLGCE